ncbi:MAG: glycosyltransferase [Firmicutes bacterium]|nr:glycosyltransferase [Bacillota bacterium]
MTVSDLKVCLLNDSFPPVIDGVSNAVVNYASRIHELGAESMVVTPEDPDADDSAFPFPVCRYPGIDAKKAIGYVAGYPFSPAVAKRIRESGVSILHSHCPIASNVFARSMRKVLNVPFVMTYHTKFDIEISEAVKGKLLQEGAIHALINNISCCDEVWVVSEGAGKNLCSMGYDGDYIVMPNGVDIPRGRLPEDETRKLTQDPRIPEGVPVYLFVGRLMWYKGIRIILDALSGLKSQGMDFRMVFAGGGQEAEEIKTYCSSLRLDDKVIFLGPVYDRRQLSAWYCRADLFLFPSDFDTNGLVVREAAACSLPAALIKGSCAAEGVTHMKNGFLIEESAASLAVLLATAGQDRRLLEKAGQAAADELYISWPQAIDRAIDRYMTVIENYRSGKYPEKKNPVDDFFQFQGTLMDLLSQSKLLEPYL